LYGSGDIECHFWDRLYGGGDVECHFCDRFYEGEVCSRAEGCSTVSAHII